MVRLAGISVIVSARVVLRQSTDQFVRDAKYPDDDEDCQDDQNDSHGHGN